MSPLVVYSTIMKKSDFIWTVGYSGNVAVINKRARASFGRHNAVELLEKGLLRPAFCTALWQFEVEKDEATMKSFLEGLSTKTGSPLQLDDAKRMMGVYQIPEGNVRTLNI